MTNRLQIVCNAVIRAKPQPWFFSHRDEMPHERLYYGMHHHRVTTA
jgi:hypothetical protein